MYPFKRPRRLRTSASIRALAQENWLSPNDLLVPLFIIEGENEVKEITSMPNYFQRSLDLTIAEVKELWQMGIKSVLLFVQVEDSLKDNRGTEAVNPEGLMQRSVYAIKEAVPEMLVMTDVALDPYSSFGHDGIVENGTIANDSSLEVLAEMAFTHVSAGADFVAPSDMMDGRIGKIRKALDKEDHQMVQILSYAVKYASSFYGPFRDAVGSKGLLKGDKKNYQMDFRNSNEAIREVALDIKEGADMVMVKPGMPYLDIIKTVKDNFKIPVLAYQVSGEYSLLSNSIKKGLIDKNSILESLISFKRAGANAIVSYYADRINDLIK